MGAGAAGEMAKAAASDRLGLHLTPWAGVAAVPSELDMLGDAAAPAWGACWGLERKVGLAKVLVFDSAATQGCRFLERRDRALYVDVDPAAMR